MKIIGILNPKGGSGKSTLCTNLARALLIDGHSVLLVDSDQQGTARDWYASQIEGAGGPEVVAMDPKGISQGLSRIASGFDYVLIDGAAKIEGKDSAKVVMACDAILIPVQPTPADIWGASDLVEIITSRQSVTNGLPRAALVVSRQIQGTSLATSVDEALRAYGLPVFESRTSQRVAYAEAMTEGLSVVDVEPDGKASLEIRAIRDELLRFING